jgi:predicted Zn-ribbon and HTH transcriptional regulator
MTSAAVPEKGKTARQAIRSVLERSVLTAREISTRVGLTEQDVVHHLLHLARSLDSRAARLIVEPPRCLSCGFDFMNRDRLTKPGRCPSCRATRIAPARFGIEAEPPVRVDGDEKPD